MQVSKAEKNLQTKNDDPQNRAARSQREEDRQASGTRFLYDLQSTCTRFGRFDTNPARLEFGKAGAKI